MTANYVLLNKITVGSGGAASVTFSSIPQTGYTDLVVKLTGRNTSSGDWFNISFNGSTANFNTRNIFGTGGAAVSNSRADGVEAFVNNNSSTTANTFSSSEIYIPNYTSSSNKSFSIDSVTENNGTTAYSILSAGLWSNSAAITSITLTPVANNLAQNSTFYLYGVVNASTAATKKATGGDIIATSGGYTYHAFLTSGTFTPTQSLSCDILVVGGGGGGGTANVGGGGGAGGLLGFTGQSLSATGYTVTVGGGGARFTNGSNSQFGGLTAAVGGGRGGRSAFDANYLPGNGGSGGGLGNNGTTVGTGTSGQGNNGGSNNGFDAAGGGGGAGAAGSSTTGAKNAAAGGTGVSSYSAWGTATNTGHTVSGTAWFAGGGASGGNIESPAGTLITTRSNGGGGVSGNGGSSASDVDGLPNTGGGGGGSTYPNDTGRAGGSGIVIVRYAV
jgi:hypothetical protein